MSNRGHFGNPRCPHGLYTTPYGNSLHRNYIFSWILRQLLLMHIQYFIFRDKGFVMPNLYKITPLFLIFLQTDPVIEPLTYWSYQEIISASPLFLFYLYFFLTNFSYLPISVWILILIPKSCDSYCISYYSLTQYSLSRLFAL